MDGQSGYLPRQPNGPVVFGPSTLMPDPPGAQAQRHRRSVLAPAARAPLATGRTLESPDEDLQRMRIESRSGTIELLEARPITTIAGFIVRGIVPPGATANAVEWIVTPHVRRAGNTRP